MHYSTFAAFQSARDSQLLRCTSANRVSKPVVTLLPVHPFDRLKVSLSAADRLASLLDLLLPG